MLPKAFGTHCPTIFALVNYSQTIEHLYQHLPLFSRIGAAAYKEDLHNTIALCNVLGDPHKKIKTIHVAGTNGKGSTCHMLAAMLQEAGYKTGLYTSPHLKDFRERIKINGEMVPEEFVIKFVERTDKITRQIQPSFFELTVAMAFEHFAEEKVDIAVIETGLGGRLDSTNIITPILSIITNIGYDHMNILGNTLEEIAAEKAGIIKAGVPVVIGEYLPQTKDLFIRKASEMNSPIRFASEEYEVSELSYSAKLLTCNVRDRVHDITESFNLDLNGLYQVKNLRTLLCAESILASLGFIINNEKEKRALQHVKKITGFLGRWDLVKENPTVILDVAHNEDGIKQVLDQVNLINGDNPKKQIHFVIGMVKDKEVSKVLALLPDRANYYFTNANIPRAMPHTELKEKAEEFGLKGLGYDNVNVAINAALFAAENNEMIIVCGSVFVVGEVDSALFS